MFGCRLNSNQARICVLEFSANRVWLVSRFFNIYLTNGLRCSAVGRTLVRQGSVLGFSANRVWLVSRFYFYYFLTLLQSASVLNTNYVVRCSPMQLLVTSAPFECLHFCHYIHLARIFGSLDSSSRQYIQLISI